VQHTLSAGNPLEQYGSDDQLLGKRKAIVGDDVKKPIKKENLRVPANLKKKK
jgi:hypothetical protein